MPRKMMTNLYYTDKRKARQDCDTLGIDRRRVQTLRRGMDTLVWELDGQLLLEPIRRPLVARLRVDPSLIDEVGVDALQHDDDCTDW